MGKQLLLHLLNGPSPPGFFILFLFYFNFYLIILFHVIRYTTASSAHHMSSISGHQTHLQPRSNVPSLEAYHAPQVNTRTRSGKVKQAWICLGPKIILAPPISNATMPIYSFLIFSLFYLILLIFLLIILINKIIFFFYKIIKSRIHNKLELVFLLSNLIKFSLT